MNQRYLWTIVALLLTTLGIPLVVQTQATEGTALASEEPPATDVVKVGEYQSPVGNLTSDAVMTEIHPHSVGGRQAATLFIRNIPVLTFLSSSKVASSQTKVGAIGDTGGVQSYALIASNSPKVGNVRNVINSVDNDPVQRAGVIAAKINQLIEDNVDASQITVSWKAGDKSTVANFAQNKGSFVQQQLGDRYTIKISDQELVEINQNTRLADTTTNLAQDALQATNRLRRLIGKASPLSQIANLPMRSPFSIPKLPQQIAVGGVRINFTGIASWYGYDGSGSQTASGERYNPEGLTAAHRTLPMGTKVRVTNTRNGRSVVVRINDRGPYIGGRIIDVSAGAARVLGMIGSGIAPVKIDVLGR
ncbi:rare lipoprotein A [Cylindrospermum stagnale PCC 7417]|uniref:Probable endolytic peptidoglycan transglycosylase RlpA n=1 Tax=Cylindrospermum stagnale PCC 7417 TaxID=56107 RepID=K9X213_9NOST|nr:septal ring lytic transglycosylase RlpA family protein [Cylindrospermum stagnale]AFZ26099.1 rare lipoprotein A [Cylindrospermum stagnale PCC 7417]